MALAGLVIDKLDILRSVLTSPDDDDMEEIDGPLLRDPKDPCFRTRVVKAFFDDDLSGHSAGLVVGRPGVVGP